MIKRTMTGGSPSWQDLVGQSKDFILRKTGSSHWTVLSRDVARPRLLKGSLWLLCGERTIWEQGLEQKNSKEAAGKISPRVLVD